MNNLKNAVGLLNAQAPDGEFLAYINPDEAKMLKDAGGSGLLTPQGIPSYFTAGQKSGDSISPGTSTSGGRRDSGGNNNNNRNDDPIPSPPTIPDYREAYRSEQYQTSPYATGDVDAENEYLEPDRDHWKATQKAIKKHQKGDHYQADWNDWTKEQQETYQLEMNKLKGTEGKNYSFYKGNEGTTNLSFGEHWKDVSATNPTLANFPLARLLIAAGRTLKENFTTDYGTYKYGAAEGKGSGRALDQGGWFGRIFNSDGTVKDNLTDQDWENAYNDAIPDLPYLVGNAPVQQTSMVDEYFKNANQQNLGISNDFLKTYNKAKDDLAKTLNMTTNASQFGYNANMSSSNIYYNYLKDEGLL
tara:strand:- start:3672 stop:4748 length:1077 start_codon:yes stop_codon:yes gene_type:complete